MEHVASKFQAFQSALKAVERPDPEAHRVNLLMEFIKLKPPVFAGSSKPAAAEKWLKKVKRKFKILGIPQEYQVGFATYLFEGSAEEWWDLHINDCNVTKPSWDEFETLFRESYALEMHAQEMTANRHKMIAEFEQLIQCNMTVAEYHARFVELSCYDPSTVANPISRCLKFKAGLRRKVRSKLATLPLTDFTALVAAAKRVEVDFLQNDGGDKGTPGSSKKMGKKDQLRDQNSNGRGRSWSSASPNSGRYQPYACYICGETGHKQRSCPERQQQSPLSSRGQ